MKKIHTLDKAINILSLRLGGDIEFKANDTDVEAFNYILGWINKEKKESVLNHVLFAKLYIYNLALIIREDESDILESVSQKKLSKILNTPLNKFIEAFQNDLYQNQIKRIIDRKKEGADITPEMIKERYDYDTINNRLINMISEAHNKFS